MRREDIQEIFAEATREQINRVLNLNSADIGEAKRAATQRESDLQRDLDAANKTIGELRKENAELPGLRDKVAEFEKADADRKAAEEQAAARAALEERFAAVSGEKKYIHDMVREGVLNDFSKALSDKANQSKSDKEIFEALTKDKGYFAKMNDDAGNMGGVGNVTNEEADQLSDAEYYAKVFEKK